MNFVHKFDCNAYVRHGGRKKKRSQTLNDNFNIVKFKLNCFLIFNKLLYRCSTKLFSALQAQINK